MDFKALFQGCNPNFQLLAELYRDLHRFPELSGDEGQTASRVALRLRALKDFVVHSHIGGHGVAGVFRNGTGPAVLLRAELDALPVKERTALDYSSTSAKKVMHACGHDMHMACLMGAAELLLKARAQWSGTLIVLFQPKSVGSHGAQAMVDDDVYGKLGVRPNVVFGQHVMGIPSGSVSIATSKPAVPSADVVWIRLSLDKGAVANPQIVCDAGALAARIIDRVKALVVQLQREGHAYIVVTTMYLNAQIPEDGMVIDQADIGLEVKAKEQTIRIKVLAEIRVIVEDEAQIAGTVSTPMVTTSVVAPMTTNDSAMAGQLKEAFVGHFGANDVVEVIPDSLVEDFSILATAVGAPYRDDIPKTIPLEGSALFAPLINPTLETGVHALSVAALTIFHKRSQED
ncbi:hypothetical protein QBC34DRAFT_295534 [Podospora aff. communis PSN243]|uniref:Peptidase M20 dimerisation domain-containing protein n=1 Tax=Podospora aff. communis PSN243 TaxID=3040156 RepID=A0AAV9GXU2_9PEZI|nr:hypothetical protein QBC34DRAFT_295534 [Podospora aff. communis PSN243]